LESDYLAHGQKMQERAINAGLVYRSESGATLYETGEESYPQMLLSRPDGFPTQHLRYAATWDAIRDEYEGMRSIGVLGAEWEPMSRFTNVLLGALHDEAAVHPHIRAIHGMVVSETGIVKSSQGDQSVLIDEVLDHVIGSDYVRDICDERNWVNPEEIGRIIVLGFFLNRPMRKRSTLTVEELLSPQASIGCSLAQAYAHAMDPSFDGDPDPDPDDRNYRALVVQSQIHQQLLSRCLERTEILPLARFHLHRSQWYLGQPESPRLARAMRAVLHAGMASLGLALRRPRPQSARTATPAAVVAP
jgi:arginyl-tRNA synthetase